MVLGRLPVSLVFEVGLGAASVWEVTGGCAEVCPVVPGTEVGETPSGFEVTGGCTTVPGTVVG